MLQMLMSMTMFLAVVRVREASFGVTMSKCGHEDKEED